jgi:hypothetical protein
MKRRKIGNETVNKIRNNEGQSGHAQTAILYTIKKGTIKPVVPKEAKKEQTKKSSI